MDQPRTTQYRTFYCDDHRREPIRLYCNDCRQPICLLCHTEIHKAHKTTDIYHAVEDCKDLLQHDIDRIVCRASERANMRQALAQERKKLKEQISRAESEINQRSDELKQIIDKNRLELIEELDTLKERRMREFDPIKTNIERHIGLLEEFRVEARDIRDKGTQVDILQNTDALHLRADQLQMLHWGQTGQGFATCDVSFAPTSLQDFLTAGGGSSADGKNLIGQIFIKRETTTADIVVRRLARLITGGCVMGVTQLAERIYVACYKSNTIRSYDSMSHQRLDDIAIKGLNYPCDIAACQATNCFYVTDGANKCAWRVRHRQDEVVTERWMEGVRLPYSLSVTSDGRVLLISRPSRLSIYRSNGRRLHVITLPADIKDPWHAVETLAGTFIVCHGCNFNLIHRICEVSRTGAMIRTYGGPPGHASGQLNQPIRLALDSEGRIFVIDWVGRRIVLLDSQLGRDRVLLGGQQEKEEAHDPQRVCYVFETGRLMVGMDTGALDIYSVHQQVETPTSKSKDEGGGGRGGGGRGGGAVVGGSVSERGGGGTLTTPTGGGVGPANSSRAVGGGGRSTVASTSTSGSSSRK